VERITKMKKINVEELRELFIEIKYGNNIAFEKLYKNYKNLVYKIAYSILKNSYDSDDIVQIVFEKIYSIDKDKLPTRNESSWLYSVTKNETINYLNKKKNHIELEEIYEIEDNNNEINELINKDSYNRLIGKLNENEKEIISLKILSNLSFKEIAKLLNKPTGTIKWIYYKSINTLKLLLSNLAMFIISFISSCFAMKNRKKLSPKLNVDESNQTKEEIKDEITEDKELLQDNKKSTITNDKSSQMQESVIEEVPNISNNYLSISLIGVSTIFFILTIIFSIIFTKHQLKRRKKLSKK
jgi:RNA polymerase sigma-70 factor (ECF subfamily)